MNRQNVTLSLPKSLLKKAKMLAASRDESLSEFLRESLELRVREASGYGRARTRQLRLLEEGFDKRATSRSDRRRLDTLDTEEQLGGGDRRDGHAFFTQGFEERRHVEAPTLGLDP